MAQFRVHGTTVIDIYVTVEAETMEEAIEIAEDNVRMVEYCNETIGAETYGAETYGGAEVCENGYIDWNDAEEA